MMSPFYRVIEAAIADIEANGYDSQERIDYWVTKIEAAARATATPEHVLQEALNQQMQSIYRRMIERGDILKVHQGIQRFTLEKLRPSLRNELDRRIMASANLIKMNRASAIADTRQRFVGWATSIPKGGTRAVDKMEVKTDLRKALTQLPFEERRVAIDQGHKFVGALNNILATNGGAIALIWKSHWRRPGYHYRKDHKERDGHVYTIRNNWAQERGLMKKGLNGYYDEVTAVGEEIFCSCGAQYLYALRDLPPEMLTIKGEQALDSIRT
jgi:hypothetical protein